MRQEPAALSSTYKSPDTSSLSPSPACASSVPLLLQQPAPSQRPEGKWSLIARVSCASLTGLVM